ncbi:MAG: hypothetical protein O2897_00665 [bacterium]|nr:hypothetical protein [bacterium]
MKSKIYIAVIIFTLNISGCSHGPSLRLASQVNKQRNIDLPVYTQAAGIKTVTASEKPILKTTKSKQEALHFAQSLVGKHQATVGKKKYTADSAGTVLAIYDFFGVNLKPKKNNKNNDSVQNIYEATKEKGLIDKQSTEPLDLIFFDSTFDRNNNGKLDDHITHVGIVEQILPDDTIIFIHFLGASIIRSRMNLKNPSMQYNTQNKERINHLLRSSTQKEENLTSAELFFGFGRINF